MQMDLTCFMFLLVLGSLNKVSDLQSCYLWSPATPSKTFSYMRCFASPLIASSCFPSQQLVASAPEADYQEPLNHRGEHLVTRNQIAMAQYECFQRIVKETHRKTKTAGERSGFKGQGSRLVSLLLLPLSVASLVGRAGVQHDVGRVAVLGRDRGRRHDGAELPGLLL